MSEQEVGNSGGEPQAKPVRARRRFLAGMVTGGLLGSLLAGSVSVFSHMKHGPGWWSHAGHGSCGYSRHGVHDPKTAGERAAFVSDWILGRIDASEEQRQQVRTIVQDAVGDVLQMKEYRTFKSHFCAALPAARLRRRPLFSRGAGGGSRAQQPAAAARGVARRRHATEDRVG